MTAESLLGGETPGTFRLYTDTGRVILRHFLKKGSLWSAECHPRLLEGAKDTPYVALGASAGAFVL